MIEIAHAYTIYHSRRRAVKRNKNRERERNYVYIVMYR
jgi:hypothetical protein